MAGQLQVDSEGHITTLVPPPPDAPERVAPEVLVEDPAAAVDPDEDKAETGDPA